jgi:hypothetical protein
MNATILCYYDVLLHRAATASAVDGYDRWMDDIFRRSKIFFTTPRKSVIEHSLPHDEIFVSVHQTDADESASVYLSVDIFHSCTRCLSVDKFYSEYYTLSVCRRIPL